MAYFGNIVVLGIYAYIAFFEEISLTYAINICIMCYYFIAVNYKIGNKAIEIQNISGV